MRELVSLTGIWTLCWLDSATLSYDGGTDEYRRSVLVALLKNMRGSEHGNRKAFFPVFNASDARESMEPILRELRATFLDVMGDAWFLDDARRGLFDARAAP